MTTRSIEYAADGLTMVGHLACPAGTGHRPAVLVGPERTGLNDFQRRRTEALAELGYVALVFDLHGGRWFTDPEEMLARVRPLLADPDRMRGIGRAALDVLRAEPRTLPDRIAAIGCGTGGSIVLELGRDGVELCAIGTVNALTTGREGEAARIRCPVWAGVGSEDPIMPRAQRDAFTDENAMRTWPRRPQRSWATYLLMSSQSRSLVAPGNQNGPTPPPVPGRSATSYQGP